MHLSLTHFLQERIIHLTPSQAREFYVEHALRAFYGELVDFLSSGPSFAMVLVREGAILKWRQLIGPTNSIKARETQPSR